MDFKKIKNEIAQSDGFDTWKLMIECYCTTEPGRRVIDKNINDLIKRVLADTSNENSGLHKHVVNGSTLNEKCTAEGCNEMAIGDYNGLRVNGV